MQWGDNHVEICLFHVCCTWPLIARYSHVLSRVSNMCHIDKFDEEKICSIKRLGTKSFQRLKSFFIIVLNTIKCYQMLLNTGKISVNGLWISSIYTTWFRPLCLICFNAIVRQSDVKQSINNVFVSFIVMFVKVTITLSTIIIFCRIPDNSISD